MPTENEMPAYKKSQAAHPAGLQVTCEGSRCCMQVTHHVQTEWPLRQLASLQSPFEEHVYHTFLQMGYASPSFLHVLLCSLSCCVSSSVLSYWQMVGVDRINDFAAADFTQVVAAAIKPFPTTILEMGCITLTLQCCPNPRCPARLPLKLMGIRITCLRTTGWIKDHILALGNDAAHKNCT